MDQFNAGSIGASGESLRTTILSPPGFVAGLDDSVDYSGFRSFGGESDVNRLSCYLHCIDSGCGLNLIQNRSLLDFENAHLLPEDLQNTIYQLAYCLYSPIDLKNFVMVGREQSSRENTVEFYTVDRIADIAQGIRPVPELYNYGLGATAEKIVVCNDDFLRDFYQRPLDSKGHQLAQTWNYDALFGPSKEQMVATFLNNGTLDPSKLAHCEHCKGSEDGCTCTHDCPLKPISRCATSLHCLHCLGKEGFCKCFHGCSKNPATSRCRLVHCPHCQGQDEPCTCPHGCGSKVDIKCHVVHSNVACQGCSLMQPIRGPRYKCTICDNFDLCRRCYFEGKHDLSHPFNCIERVGSVPAALWSRETLSRMRSERR